LKLNIVMKSSKKPLQIGNDRLHDELLLSRRVLALGSLPIDSGHFELETNASTLVIILAVLGNCNET
jgi:hypothetical protein